jgi:hypothetical protein
MVAIPHTEHSRPWSGSGITGRIAPLVAVTTVIAINAAATLLPLNGYSTGELSDLNPTGFTPAGYAFSIWSLIYTGLIAFAISQLVGSEVTRRRGDRIRGLVIANSLANVSWIFCWHYRQVALSFVAMIVILATLIAIYISLRRTPATGWRQRLLVDAPFSLYLGWISAATLLNLAAVFYSRGQYPFELAMDQWALISVATAVAIYAWVSALTRDPIYGGVFVWAALAIAAKPDGISEPVRLVALAGAAALITAIVWMAIATAVRLAPATIPRGE